MKFIRPSLFLVVVLLLSGIRLQAVAEITTFTSSSDLNLSEGYTYAVNLGNDLKRTAINIGDVTFHGYRDVEGVRVKYVGQHVEIPYYETAPSYTDKSLGCLMHGLVMSYGGSPSSVALEMDVVSAQTYELKMFFSENNYAQANARSFDIRVDGKTVVGGAFTPIPSTCDWSSDSAPHTGVMVTYRFVARGSQATIELVQGLEGDSSPYMNAFTLLPVSDNRVSIPESSNYGLIFGGMALCGALLRRRLQ